MISVDGWVICLSNVLAEFLTPDQKITEPICVFGRKKQRGQAHKQVGVALTAVKYVTRHGYVNQSILHVRLICRKVNDKLVAEILFLSEL